jgi:hypothetical protein
METEMRDIIITALITFILTFGLVVNIESKIQTEKARAGFIIIDNEIYLLTRLRAPQ